jgi:hypothetical protein
MQTLLARFIAVVLTVMPWVSTWLAAPRVEKTEAALSSPQQPAPPQVSNLTATGNFNAATEDWFIPPRRVTLPSLEVWNASLPARAKVLHLKRKLFQSYSRLQLDGG